MATEILQLVRADEPLPQSNLEVRALELDAVPDECEVDVLLTTLGRELIEIALGSDLRDSDVRRLGQLNDPHVMRVRNRQKAVPTRMWNRSTAEVALARVTGVCRPAGPAVEGIGAARDRARAEPDLGAVGCDAQIRIDAGAVAGGEVDLRGDHRPGAAPERDVVPEEHGEADVGVAAPVRDAALDGAGRGGEQRHRRDGSRERSYESSHRVSHG